MTNWRCVHRCKSRKMDAYSLTEYRSILAQTLQDIMAVFNDPEWPVAELIIRVFSRILVGGTRSS